MTPGAPLPEVRLVLITAPDTCVASALAERLVGEQLAACVNIVPGIRSVYRWEGKVQQDEEQLLLVKTTAERFPELESKVREWHPYEVPECIALPVSEGSRTYLEWVAAGCRPG